jgi:hypothetical protein
MPRAEDPCPEWFFALDLQSKKKRFLEDLPEE